MGAFRAAVGAGVAWFDSTLEGRSLTADERRAAELVFRDKINYEKVRIINGKYLPWQPDDIVMSPDGNIYWPGESGNLANADDVRIFIHEMTHVMQYQNGINVFVRGAILQAAYYLRFKTYDPYSLQGVYQSDRAFSTYNIEQQGRIAEKIYYGDLPNNIDYPKSKQ